MARRTIADALTIAPASTAKTSLTTNFTSLAATIDAAVIAGSYSANQGAEFYDEMISLAERWAANLRTTA